MSNTVQVRIKGRINYYSFRWDGDVLLVFIKKEWRAVWRTAEKRNGEYVFELAS